MGIVEEAEKVIEAAAEALIRETGNAKLLDTSAEAEEAAKSVHGFTDFKRHEDGTVTVSSGTGPTNPDGTTLTFYSKDSQAFEDIISEFAWIKDKFEYFDELPAGESDSAAEMKSVVAGFDTEGSLKGLASSFLDGSTRSQDKKDGEDGGSPGEFKDWADLNEVFGVLEDWRGDAAKDFTSLYANRFDYILTGQMAALCISQQTLEIADNTYKNARSSAVDIAEKTVNALDGLSAGDADWEATLTVLSAVASIAGGAAGLAASPLTFGASISGIAGIVGGASSLASYAAAGSSGEEVSERKPDIGGSSVDEVLSAMSKALELAKDDVGDVERNTSEWLSEFQLWLEEHGEEVFLSNGKAKQLTIRESYFEPPKPGLAEVGESHAEKSEGGWTGDEANSAANDILDMDNLGRTRSPDRELVQSDLQDLKNLGNGVLPAVADRYSEVASEAGNAGDAASSAFSEGAKEDPNPEGAYASAGVVGSLYSSWQSAHELAVGFLSNSGETFKLVGQTVSLAAEAFEELDDASATDLWKAWED